MTTVKLNVPVVHEGITYSEVSFRPAELGDLMEMLAHQDQVSQGIAILASVSNMPLEAFKRIRTADFMTIMNHTADILGDESTGSYTVPLELAE
jgi:hypothetical protein